MYERGPICNQRHGVRSRTLGLSFMTVLLWGSVGCEATQRESVDSTSQAVTAAKASPATDLQANAQCSPAELGTAMAQLRWKPSGAEQQRVELTILPDGFEKGQFETSTPLSGDVSTYTWKPLQGQAIHFWRVSSSSGAEWVPSATSTFTGPTCVRTQVGEP